MASMAELTSGIAHEIQNPLNFVNNFSELSVELINEIAAPDGGATDESWIPDTPYGGWGAFLGDLSQNLEKINQHGKRASGIVKGMLEHSRSTAGERRPTDLNKLVEVNLSTAFQKNKSKIEDTKVELVTDFAPNLREINVVPQEMSRVLLNIFNNAFWAVGQRTNVGQSLNLEHGGDYAPKVTVSTKIANNRVFITVTDNGTGMSNEVKAKIFQPFFTTKPTGEGTGLGLSLTYDIITNGHGGTIEVETKEGEGTTFIVKLPI
jgi:signal transduction histidine kinase